MTETRRLPIKPTAELLQQWMEEYFGTRVMPGGVEAHLVARAAQWGADQELEACCDIALTDPVCGTKHQRSMLVRHIRETRRPKPPSLKEQAFVALYAIATRSDDAEEFMHDVETIKEALKLIPDQIK